MPSLHDLRVDCITGEDQAIRIRNECHTVPSLPDKPYVSLLEYPSQCPGCDDIRIYASEPPITILGTDDATIYQATPNTNYGVSGTGFQTVRTGSDIQPVPGIYRGMFGFSNLASGPVEAFSAKLFIRLAYTPAAGQFTVQRSIGVHNVTGGPWSEGAVTWNNQPGHEPVAADVTLIDGMPLADDWKSWDITNLYNLWKGLSVPNYGLKLVDGNATDADIQRDWRSKEYLGGSFAPYLEVVGATPDLIQVAYPPGPGEYSINKDRAVIALHPSLAGLDVCVSYCGRGSNLTAQRLCDLISGV